MFSVELVCLFNFILVVLFGCFVWVFSLVAFFGIYLYFYLVVLFGCFSWLFYLVVLFGCFIWLFYLGVQFWVFNSGCVVFLVNPVNPPLPPKMVTVFLFSFFNYQPRKGYPQKETPIWGVPKSSPNPFGWALKAMSREPPPKKAPLC